ncbi:MAG: fibronectin type III domain-containing protein, partial [Ilumatobacteraceae bacterium]|nr:fibronectin type III domain-containing protein [Ilumatobacteraceae bacterium]
MRHSTKLSLAIVTVGVLVLSACGNSTAKLLDSTTTKTKNSSLDDNSGLNAKAMTYNREEFKDWQKYPNGQGVEDQILRDESKYKACPEGTPASVSTIDNGPLTSITKACRGEFIAVHYTGFVTVPGNAGEDVAVKFKVAKDDTFFLTIDGKTVVDAWKNTGCAWVEGSTTLKAGQQYPLDAWFTQYGGGICNQMTWSLNGGAFEIVPQSSLARATSVTTGSEEVTTTTVAEEVTTTTEAPVVTTTTEAPVVTTTTEAVAKIKSFSIQESETMLVEGDETYNVANNKTFRAPAGKKFGKVLWASYGTPTVQNLILTLSGCNSATSVSVVEAAAAGKTSFVLPAGNRDYGDPCYGTYKRVKALITLVTDENYVANPMETGVAIDAPNTSYFETRENYAKAVTAPEGKMFGKVLFASYGIQNLKGNMVSIGWCHSKTSVELVKAALENKASGTIPASNGNYGDPCWGTYKYVKVVMSLIDDPDYVKATATTVAVEPASIAAPTNVVAVAGNGSASITWNASKKGNTEVTGYLVQVSADGFVNSTTIKVTSTEAIALGLSNGQVHEIRVSADNTASGVISEWTTTVKTTPTAPAVTTTTTVVEEGTVTKALVVSKAVIVPEEKTVTIEADATSIDCDNACFASIAASLGATDAPVYVSIDGGERISIDGADFSKIAVGPDAKKITFMTLVDSALQQTTFDVNRSGEVPAAPTGGGSSSSSNNLLLLLILGAVVLCGGGGYAYS